MRLHRLTLRDVKGVTERTVDLPDRGVVVIEGPNEIGKTTLLEAFDALLAFKASSKARPVVALQPVGRDVGPAVEAEFTVGDTRVTYAKQWLRQSRCTLTVHGDHPEHLTGDAAQQRVDQLLDRHLDRTLWDALRLTQAGDGAMAPLTSSGVLAEALDAAAGAQQHSDDADLLLTRVDEEYAMYWTPTGRPTGVYRQARADHAEAQIEVAEAHRRVEESAALVADRVAARDRVDAAERSLETAGETLATAEEVARRVAAVTERHRTAVAERDRLAGEHRAVRQERDTRRSRVEALDRCRAAVQEATETEQAADERAAVLLTRGKETAEAVSTTRDAEAAAAAHLDRARLRLDHGRAVDDAESRARDLARVEAAVHALAAAREALPTHPVTEEDARAVARLADRIELLTEQHRASSPTLHVESLGAELHLEDQGAEEGTDPRIVRAGEVLEHVVTDDLTLQVPGAARVRLVLQDEARVRAADLERYREELRAQLDRHGATDPGAVAEQARLTREAAAAVAAAERDVRATVTPLGSGLVAECLAGQVPAALSEAVSRAREQVEVYAAQLTGDEVADENGPGVTALRAEVDRAAEVHREARSALTRAVRAEQELHGAVREAREAVSATRDRRLTEEARRDTLTEELTRARAERSDEDLAELLVERGRRLERAESVVGDVAAELARLDPVAGTRALDTARAGHRAAVTELETARTALHTLTGQIQMVAGEGRPEAYDRAVAALEVAEQQLRAVDRRARAVRHLREVLHRHRDDAHRSYVRPYTTALEELGRRVYGDGFSVAVDEHLALASRTLDGVTVPVDQLSGGAREQLGILARLAVSRLVDPVRGVPVVIDDALGYSDPDRLRQMGRVMSGAAEGRDVQVILLTCTPERYAGVPGADTVRLERDEPRSA